MLSYKSTNIADEGYDRHPHHLILFPHTDDHFFEPLSFFQIVRRNFCPISVSAYWARGNNPIYGAYYNAFYLIRHGLRIEVLRFGR
jgi:hypothetical protein